MKKQPWIFTGNTFNRATRGSHPKMLNIASDTDLKLQGQISNPDINAIYTDYHPVYVAYTNICLNYDIATGAREGDTLNVETLLTVNIKEQMALWEGKVRSVYPQGSPQERAYFPDGRTPFWSGSYAERILHVRQLAEKLAADPSAVLTAYAPAVMSFYNTLLSARGTQVGGEGMVGTLSTARENQRQLVAKALYTVLARLMYLYHSDSSQIANYFDLELIRTRRKDSFPATSLEIRGKVTIEGSATPVVNATVSLDDVEAPRLKIKASVNETITTTTTDEQGRYKFRFDNLQPHEAGMLKITIDSPGFQHYEQVFPADAGEIIVIDVALALGMMKVA